MGSQAEVTTLFSQGFPTSFVTFLLNGNVWALQGKSLRQQESREFGDIKLIRMTVTQPPTKTAT